MEVVVDAKNGDRLAELFLAELNAQRAELDGVVVADEAELVQSGLPSKRSSLLLLMTTEPTDLVSFSSRTTHGR